MHRIPIFVHGLPGLNSPDVHLWKVLRWTVPDGERIHGPTIIAELECDIAVVEHEVSHSGILRHDVAAGERFQNTRPIGKIECTEFEYETYLQLENARRICVRLAPGELRLVEELKAGETNEEFVLTLVRKELRRLESEREA